MDLTLRKRLIKNRIKILFQRLELITLYRSEFVEKLGEKGTEDKIDQTLDEINVLRTELHKLNKIDKT